MSHRRLAAFLVVGGACGSGADRIDLDGPRPATIDASLAGRVDAPAASGPPRLGAHDIQFHRINGSVAGISSDGLTTQSGSTILVFEGRGDIDQFGLTTDNKGNAPYVQLGDVHA